MAATNALKAAFATHPRQWRDFFYVYPVISRRSGGLSIGINLNPDAACNFDCIYCCVDRTVPPRIRTVEPLRLEAELRSILQNHRALFDEPEFCNIPPAYQRLNDLAFSGDGEPTTSLMFPTAAHLAVNLLNELGLRDVKIVTITDACYLMRPAVAETLSYLDQHNGEIWAKLDAGTEEYFRLINRPNFSLQHVVENIVAAARIRPIVIQSLFMRVHGQSPPTAEIDAYVSRLREIQAAGGKIKLVQIYTTARRTAQPYVTALPIDELNEIAEAVRATGLAAESFA